MVVTMTEHEYENLNEHRNDASDAVGDYLNMDGSVCW